MSKLKKKKTVFIVTERFYPEDFRINDLARELIDKGYAVKILAQTPSYPYGKVFSGYSNKILQKEIWNGVEINRVYSVMGYKDSFILKILNYLLHFIFASIVIPFKARLSNVIFVYHTGPLTNAIPAIVMKKIFRKKTIIWTTDIWPDAVYSYGFRRTIILEKALNIFIRFVYKNFDQILVSSPGFIDRIKNYVSEKQIEYLPHWANEEIFNAQGQYLEFETGSDKTVFTFAGNIGKLQNLDNVIRAFALVKNANAKLIIVGDGSFQGTLKELVMNLNVKNIEFMGRKPPAELYGIYSKSDVLIVSLKRDPFLELTIPGKFQTCLMANKPIFAIIKGEVEKLVQTNKLGLCADPDDVNSITKGFELFCNKTVRDQYTLCSRNLYQTDFNKKLIIDKLVNLLNLYI